jgi:hypothetical protein
VEQHQTGASQRDAVRVTRGFAQRTPQGVRGVARRCGRFLLDSVEIDWNARKRRFPQDFERGESWKLDRSA